MRDKTFSPDLARRDVLKIGGAVIGAASFGKVNALNSLVDENNDIQTRDSAIPSKIDFSYAFGTPHRITATGVQRC